MFPANPGENWLQKNLDKYNADAKVKADGDLRIYEQNVAQWIVNNVHNREIGQAISPAPAIPMVVEWYDGGGFLAPKPAVPNPLAKPAVLPPPVATVPNSPAFGGTTAGARDAEMFRLLYQIEANTRKA